MQSQFPFLAATAYATADKGRCVSVAKFIAWLFAFDDINDDLVDGVGSNFCAAEELFQGLEDALQAKPSASGERRVVAVALDWWREMCAAMPATQKARFLRVFRDSLEAWKAQISCRQAQTIPDVQTYILRRRKASALFTAFLLLEYSMGIELDEEALGSDLLSQLHDAVIDHVSWVNDLLSLKSEYSRGEYDNIPSVVCFNDQSNDFQISVQKVSRMIAQRDNDYMRLLNQIKISQLMEKPGLDCYLDGLANWMSGNLYWSYVTARYHGVDAEPTPAVARPLSVILHPVDSSEYCIRADEALAKTMYSPLMSNAKVEETTAN